MDDRHPQGSRRRALRSVPLVVTVAGVLMASACEGASPKDDASSPEPSASSSATEPVKAEEKQVLQVVKAMYRAQTRVFANGTEKGSDLEKYAADKALGKTREELFSYKQAGIVLRGQPEYTQMRVTALDMKTSPQRATVQSCTDTSGWTPVKKASGKEVKIDGQPRRYIVTASLQTIDKQWMVITHKLDKDRSC